MKTKFKASKSKADSLKLLFETVEFKSETSNFITLKNGNRNAKETEHYKLFDTFQEARSFVLSNHAIEVIKLRKEIKRLHERVEQISEIGFCCANCQEVCYTEDEANKHCLENICGF